ncbi:MAG: hypothetical protein ABH834_07165 [Candidatus Altiarchaeota archaeon]
MKTRVVDGHLSPEKRLDALMEKHGIKAPEPKTHPPANLFTGLPPELTDRLNAGAKSHAILDGAGRMLDEMASAPISAARRAELKADAHEMLDLWDKLYKPKTDEEDK